MRIQTGLGILIPFFVLGCDLPLCKRNPAWCDVQPGTEGGEVETGASDETSASETSPAETGSDAGEPEFCGGIAGFPCPDDLVCVDDPRDDCDPRNGGADCGGICVERSEPTCETIVSAFAQETREIRSCERDDECGQVLTQTSCGCTRDWVARNDAELEDWDRLRDEATENDCEIPGGVSTCDCPAADGFACVDGTCTWNYL